MAMNRSQMFKQVRGYASGGAPGTGGISGLSELLGLTPAESILGGAPPPGTSMMPSFDPMNTADIDPTLAAMAARPRRDLTPVPGPGSAFDELIAQAKTEADKPFAERREGYLKDLEEIMGPRQEPMDIYDLAGTVGRAMLAADPRAGAFRSMGVGLSDFSARVKELEKLQSQQDRQIAMKAYELARTDEQAAKDLVRDYMVLKAKEAPAGKLTAYKVTNPAGITIGGRHYDAGEEVFLDEYEARAARTSIGSATGNTGWKSPGAAMTAIWQDDATARETIKSLGMSEDNPNFERAVAMISTTDQSKIGRPIIQGGAYTELRPLVSGDQVFNVMLGASDSAGTPFMQTWTEERVKELARKRDDLTAATQTIQRVRSAREQLRTDPKLVTGAVEAAFLPVRKAVASAFGLQDDELVGLESLEAVLNYLGPRMRVAGSGPTSDRDMKIQMSSIGTLANTPQANYISLYAFERMTENAQLLSRLEEEALTSGMFNNTADLNRYLEANDPGLFERFDGDPEDDAAIQAWYDALPEGAVIDNTQRLIVDADGNPIPTPFIIKGWVARSK